jgi:signal transduction histidine kinase
MGRFRDLSIKWKLTLIILTTSTIALVLAGGASVVYELILIRRTQTYNLSTLADVIGTNSTAAIEFNDPKAAGDSLAALKAYPSVAAALIYTKGRLFSSYLRGDVKEHFKPPDPREYGYRFEEGHLAVFRPIVLEGETIGAVYIQSDLKGMHALIRQYIGVVVLVLLGSSCVAIVLASRLQRVISEPIFHLVQTAKIVSSGKNYSIRAVKRSRDDLGVLIDGFNEMLSQIQNRDEALQRAHDQLEKRVAERTRDLQQEVAERKRAEEALKDYSSRLEAANKELEAFSYSVSHDLRAPLRGIDGFSLILLEDYGDKLDAEGKGYLNRTRAAALRMGQLIDDMLQLSRMMRSEMKRETVDLSAIATEIAADLQRAQPGRRAEFIIAPRLVVNGDLHLLRIALENLLGNAWKFTGKRPRAEIELNAAERGGERVYFIRDNGAGFDMAHADKLFGAFQRLHAMNEFEGTGVGLATVQRIIHRHGGRIWAEAAVEKGATFYFTLQTESNA